MPSQDDEVFINYVRDGHYVKAVALMTDSGVNEQYLREAITYLLAISNDAEQEKTARINALGAARNFSWKLRDQSTEYQIFEARLMLDIGLMTYC